MGRTDIKNCGIYKLRNCIIEKHNTKIIVAPSKERKNAANSRTVLCDLCGLLLKFSRKSWEHYSF